MKNKTICISDEQAEFIDNQSRKFNLSKLVQKAINKEMEKTKTNGEKKQ